MKVTTKHNVFNLYNEMRNSKNFGNDIHISFGKNSLNEDYYFIKLKMDIEPFRGLYPEDLLLFEEYNMRISGFFTTPETRKEKAKIHISISEKFDFHYKKY